MRFFFTMLVDSQYETNSPPASTSQNDSRLRGSNAAVMWALEKAWMDTGLAFPSSALQLHRAIPRPHFGKSDHLAVLLLPAYKQRVKCVQPTVRSVQCWSAPGKREGEVPRFGCQSVSVLCALRAHHVNARTGAQNRLCGLTGRQVTDYAVDC